MIKCIALTSILAVLATGCSLAPTYERPVVPVPEQYLHSSMDGPSAERSSELPEWRVYFRDPILRQLIAAALDGNADLRIAILRISEARAGHAIQRSERAPSFEARAEYSRTSSAGAADERFAGNQYQLRAGIPAFELDLFGRVKSLSEAALARYLATQEAALAVRISLIASVANTYVQERSLAELERLAIQTLQSRESSLGTIQRRFGAGVSTAIELRTAQMLVETARASLASIVRERNQARSGLQLLVGDFEFEPRLPGDGLESITFERLVPSLPSTLLERRPDIREAELRLKAANADIGAARAAFFPRVTLTGENGAASRHLSQLFEGASGVWSFMPQMTLPIFMAGRNRATLDVSQVRREISVREYERAIQVAFREVSDALMSDQLFSTQVEAQQAVEAADRERLRLAQRRYDRGVANYLELLDAQRSHFESSQELVRLRALRLGASIELYKVLGGGLETREAG